MSNENMQKEISLYYKEDLAAEEVAREWQTSPQLILAALSMEGENFYSKEQAKKIVEKFKRKEVL